MSAGPLCRCRVLYIGSAVPTITKDGLQGIQQPLRERYPNAETTDTKGIDSWLSVWSNGLLLEYIDGASKTESAFFPITTLHYCAGVRYVNVSGFSIEGGGERFIPLDSPFAQIPNSPHPPIFAAIFRRTSGIKVLECHGFICTNERAANALVRCCFHAYADTIYLKMDDKVSSARAIKDSSERSRSPSSEMNSSEHEQQIDEVLRDEASWNERAIDQKAWYRRQQNGEYDASSLSSSLYRKTAPKRADTLGKHGRQAAFDSDRQLLPYMGDSTWKDSNHSDYEAATVGRGPRPHYPISYGRPPFAPPPLFGFGPPFMIPPPMAQGPKSGKEGKHKGKKAHIPPPMAFFPPMMPAYMMPPHPFAMRHPFGPPPPPPMGGRFPPQSPFPPHMLPPRFPFMPQFMGPPPHERTEGPIITEQVYDTFPRRGMNYEEPIYMPSNNSGVLPPHSSYKPDTMPPEHYESYYDNRAYHNRRGRKNTSASESEDEEYNRGARYGAYWNDYEAGAYRKANMNGGTLGRDPTSVPKQNGQTAESHAKSKEYGKPVTPPADYGSDNELNMCNGAHPPTGVLNGKMKAEEDKNNHEANTRQAPVASV